MNEYLLDDAAMRNFLVNGFLIRKLDLPPGFNEGIYDAIGDVFARDGNPGNNVLPWLPQLQRVFDDPAVRGTLESLLGPTYVMHCHRHPHVTGPHGKGMGWHKDSYWGYYRIRDHHPRWVMAMYYPQDVPVEFGPTGAIPGSQYFETQVPRLAGVRDDLADGANEGIPAVLEAGSVLFIHFDLWHKAYPNFLDKTRYMFKFQFTRLDEPTGPCWNKVADRIPLGEREDDPRAPIWRQMWHWLAGESGPATTGDPGALAETLRSDSEIERLGAAYTLGGLGPEGTRVLLEALEGARDEVKRDAGYGLAAAGDDAVPGLVAALSSTDENVRAHALYALGDRGPRAAGVADALRACAHDPSEKVRRTLADALGQVRADPEASVAVLEGLLRDGDEQVRFNAAYALAKFRGAAAAAVSALAAGLEDENRYVRGHCAVALEQVGTREATGALLHHLQAMRFCASTTRDSTF
ncbi:MAG: HEAT repeat domain-containing protein [Armatimonadota bacterium]